jgi:hypothetical protein
MDAKKLNEVDGITNKCAFCGENIEPNFFNACEDCQDEADREPEKFINKVLN